jgi:hypothetical protein
MIQYLFFGFIFLAILLYSIYLMLEIKAPSGKEKKYFEKPKTNYKSTYNIKAQQAYVLLLRMPFVKKLVLIIRRKIELVSDLDEYRLRREVMNIVFAILSISTLIIIGFAIFIPNWNVMIWVLIGLAFTSGVLIDLFVYRVEERILIQLKEYLGHLRYFYQHTKMVEESAYEAMQVASPDVKKQAERMYEILISADPNKALQKYEEVVPNRFLKVIAGLLVMISEQGDVETEKGSSFLRGLTNITQELNDEYLFRTKLRYKMRGLTVVALIPVFFALPIKNWAMNYFPTLMLFYDSWIGLFSQLLVYVVAFISFYFIRKMKEINEANYNAVVKKKLWEDKILKFKYVKRFIHLIVPSYYQRKHYQLTKLIKEANSHLILEAIYLRRVLLAGITFLVLVTTSIIFHVNEKHNVLYESAPSIFYVGEQTEEDVKANEALTEFDREVILKIIDWAKVEPSEVNSLVAKEMKLDEDDSKVESTTERILGKFATVQNSFTKWWEVLIAITFALLAYHLPVWVLYFQRSLRKKEMENEVNQFYILIGVLKEFDRMSVEVILIWLERFSVVFKDPLRECLQDFDSGPEEAFQNLREKVSFEPFNQVISRLELSIVKISIQQAFNDSDVERDYYISQRKEINERSITEKGWWGEILGLAPVYTLIFLYLIAPFLYISIAKSGELLKQIQTF